MKPDAFGARVKRMTAKLARTAPGPLAVRLVLALWTLLALALCAPGDLLLDPRLLLTFVIVSAIVPLVARTRIVTIVILICGSAWLSTTAAFGEPVTVVRLVALSAVLYLLHTTAALVAVLPYDAVVAPAVLALWFLRAVGVLVASTAFGALALAGAQVLTGQRFLAAAVVGAGTVAALGWLLVRAVKRG